ncbi:3-methyladenine DNA glycosylase [Alkalihalophilus pseudofirmus OF4]|uniref:Putative 3-methyladenine DNA glycosylase n=1 Tax=Alkalihalophilus pseudofirmus (strain ATCC BAA-2126 / JCM 17055 / OF4) TaxID=398511 RepID=D3FSR6_ALKPO|nr:MULTISPECIES: DNA-3-methyladenine glycosylase [Alkalihalophilus]ADC51781.1 3-methyladenine DNA glycosylase [Alkalihalophilus pseudofirmus OF4]MED1603566.1 DNA-3-methyladenine glycosylase [Alkalihalophilus marmarensis]
MPHTILPREFYDQPTLDLAKALLGKLLVHETSEGICSGYIVETEAYRGPDDQAAHSYQNLRTKRTEVMFGENGHCYAHVMHTHCLINVVSGGVDRPEGVLIRALEPVSGIDLMYKRREKAKRDKDLTSGPGKLTKALNITKADYGKPFFQPPLYIAEGKEVSQISMGPRIGIDNSGEAKDYPWRFWETGNPYVSR